MKKIITLLLLAPLVSWAQVQLVSSAPENRSALIEHFTGINSGDGVNGYNALLTEFQSDPQRTAVISYHAGGGAIPISGQPDFQTTDGAAINLFFSVQSSPRGVVGRRLFQQVFQIHFDDYDVTSALVRNLPSPVNLGMASSFDATTRDLTVDVEILYTADGTGGNDLIYVALVESDLIADQVDFSSPTGITPNFSHPWVFREALTPTWGDEVMNNTAGNNETRTYTFANVPAAYDISNCDVVAYIGELQGDVYQAKFVPAVGGSTQVGIEENILERALGEAFPVPAQEMLTIPFFDLKEDATLRITDMLGRVVNDQTITPGTQQVNLAIADWPAGVYSYQIISETGAATKARKLQVL